MQVWVEVGQVPEALHEHDQTGPGAGGGLGVRIAQQARGDDRRKSLWDAAQLAQPGPLTAEDRAQELRAVNTYCRCATGASTFCSTHSPYKITRFW